MTATERLSPRRYSMLDVDQAPQSPGLYAWYVGFLAGPHDWRTDPGPDGDMAVGGFLRLLTRYASHFEPLPIALRSSGSYGSVWQGSLERDAPLGDAEDKSQGLELEDKRLDQLMDSLGNEDRRRAISEILAMAAPVFSTPLYIGVATDLRERLCVHRRDFGRAYEWLRDHPDDRDRLRLEAKNFGSRAAARNITMDRLEAWVIDVGEGSDNEFSTQKLRQIAQTAEWLLNRFHTPILGRQ
ncbi:hypothetical protein ACQP1O_33080 [Nocardia sp. CA-151230]|uniref:hypothetical protein n=1 Tax=Nocardia sp. CA-151230 TaxID=3239982 RepID=UPI003D8D5A30